jgi:hypothetical protein
MKIKAYLIGQEVKKSFFDFSGFKEELIYWSGGYEKLI